MRFSFLTAIVALTTSIMSVTAGQPGCTPLGEKCNQDSDCCNEFGFELVNVLCCSLISRALVFALTAASSYPYPEKKPICK
ncbi:hypothetical protein BDR04DRAFT_1105157 [Suillus decipiens]|nr:hypothetical protein BDR04DRAFT_1105157 [Suillus decipiens]